jgi:uncharacterized membrane protein
MAQQYGTSMDVTSDDKLWVLLAYIFSPIVPIILLLMEDKKNRPFIKAHNMQALIWGALVVIVGTVTSAIFIGLCILPVGWALSIYWGIQGYQGKYVTIPVLTNFIKQQGWA